METNQTTQTTTPQPIANKNMINCKTCGAPIAKSAKKCTSCGAKNKKKQVIKIIIPLVIILVFVGAYVSKVMDFNSHEAVLTVNGTEYTWAEYKDLYHDYYLNGKSIEFDEEFVPANVVTTGKITKISDAIIGETMDGNLPDENTMMKYQITIDDNCTYSVVYGYYEQNDYDFSHLAVGDEVTVKGIVTEEDLFPTNIIKERLDGQLKITGTADGITKN